MGLLENTIGAMFGRPSGGDAQGASGSSPYPVLVTALIGLLAAKAATGGFGNLGGLLGGSQAPGTPTAPQPGQTPPAAPGGGLLSGLGGLLNQFQQSGHGGLIESWIGSGHNAPATPGQVTQALGPDTVQELSQKTGLSAQEVASQLSQELPAVIDKLTPQGRLPTPDEVSAWH